MGALITTALLIAFGAALAMQGTEAQGLIRYVDPAVLALLALFLLPLPFREARESFAEILMISPTDLDAHVRSVMEDFVRRHGFQDYRSYLSKAGRARFIEISVLVPSDLKISIAEIDAMRAEIGAAIGRAGPDRWLTIIFTGDSAEL
jgi:predicted Co/Zn/Cd cation transporter (cation efflux family)